MFNWFGPVVIVPLWSSLASALRNMHSHHFALGWVCYSYPVHVKSSVVLVLVARKFCLINFHESSLNLVLCLFHSLDTASTFLFILGWDQQVLWETCTLITLLWVESATRRLCIKNPVSSWYSWLESFVWLTFTSWVSSHFCVPVSPRHIPWNLVSSSFLVWVLSRSFLWPSFVLAHSFRVQFLLTIFDKA